jgi:hypothetical protein
MFIAIMAGPSRFRASLPGRSLPGASLPRAAAAADAVGPSRAGVAGLALPALSS